MWKPYTKARIAIALVGCVSAVFLPWWMLAGIILVLASFWRAWEAILLGLFMDFLWLPTHSLPLFTISALLIVWCLEPVRKEFLIR